MSHGRGSARMPDMSEPQRQASQPGRAAVFIGVAAGLGANVAIYLVAWWISKRTPTDWGGYAGFALSPPSPRSSVLERRSL